MSLEILKENIEREKLIARQIYFLVEKIEAEKDNKKIALFEDSIDQLVKQLKIINQAVPDLINNVSFYQKLQPEVKIKENKDILNIKYNDQAKEISLGIKKKDEKSFVKTMSAQKSLSEKIVKTDASGDAYVRMSNKLFRRKADELVGKGYFNSLRSDLKKITSSSIVNSYVAVMLFSTVISVIMGIIAAVVLILFKLYLWSIGVFILIPVITFLMIYLYPASTKKSLEKEINQELPFVTIYLSAISTSGIEPSKIFHILSLSKDYPYTQREISRLNNYINFYGYDLVSALKKVSENSPSERLSQLFDGFATTITSGGELSSFLNKHAEGLLFDYRLEREKYTHLAETFMNIYISVVIAAPMILMILFVIMGMIGFGNLNPVSLSFLVIFIISLINVLFIVFLNIKQPKF